MGTKQSCPMKRRTIYFESPANYTSTGTKRDEELAPTHTILFHKIHEPFWDDLLAEREANLIAKNKLFNMDKKRIEMLTQKFKGFTPSDIHDLRFHFQCLDLNNDWLIDKNELMHALRSTGENFDVQKMEECFREIDKDNSGLIDFEEYIELIHRLQYGAEDDVDDNVIQMMRSVFEEEALIKLKKFSTELQIKAKLF